LGLFSFPRVVELLGLSNMLVISPITRFMDRS
jgi:hypothetical protein